MHGSFALRDKSPATQRLIDYGYALGRHHGLQAEIRSGHTPQWHVLVTVPGQERIAAAHLSGRRFGIYLPEIEIDDKSKTIEPMFRGYLFVFVWDIDFHWRRILACPGVVEILQVDGQPAVLPSHEIDRIRSIENENRPLRASLESVAKPKKRHRGYHKSKQKQSHAFTESEIISVRTWSAFTDGINRLDAEARTTVLERALGLVS